MAQPGGRCVPVGPELGEGLVSILHFQPSILSHKELLKSII